MADTSMEQATRHTQELSILVEQLRILRFLATTETVQTRQHCNAAHEESSRTTKPSETRLQQLSRLDAAWQSVHAVDTHSHRPTAAVQADQVAS